MCLKNWICWRFGWPLEQIPIYSNTLNHIISWFWKSRNICHSSMHSLVLLFVGRGKKDAWNTQNHLGELTNSFSSLLFLPKLEDVIKHSEPIEMFFLLLPVLPRSVNEYQIIPGLTLDHRRWGLLPSTTTGGMTDV